MLKILGKASSINVRKVLWACDELGLPFEREDWGSGFRATDTADYLALNPNAMVPVLCDGDFVLWESNAIIRYLAAAYGDGRLLPVAPRERARIEQWMDWQATELNNSWRYAFVALVRKNPDYSDAAALAASVASWTRHIGILEQQLATTGAYVTGNSFSLADIPLGLSVNRWLMTPLQHAHYPAVAAYFDRLSQRPGFLRHGRNGLP
ncbi:putative glutathione S-transferase-like protein [Collimonas arenae]|uniref:Putative glutathione S-transferase-like protein n=1 Tax=Collimonas arenae TaxID=279058 RepID=A0A0A1F653_9BURK|nr:glutathione S-transferase family protein [Collimonas arenae]AIY39245.1 putative glutathione S-transferase-like protein [Collimonas arenae]